MNDDIPDMKTINKAILVILICLFSRGLFAQDLQTHKLDAFFKTIEAYDAANGELSILIDGEIVYNKVFGSQHVNDDVNKTQLYRVGSISKSFTATLILKLIEEGKLEFDTKLSTFYPDFKNADKISIYQLLSHQTGLFNFTTRIDYMMWADTQKSKEELLTIMNEMEPIFEPGERHSYSNTNYVLLGFILEDVTGQSYEELLEKYIITPLELEHTKFTQKISGSEVELRSYSIKPDNTWVPFMETDLSIPLAAGAIRSTPTELTYFLKALLDGQIISQEMVSKMTNLDENYGLGMFAFPFYDIVALGHNGRIDAFESTMGYIKEDDVCFAITTNGLKMNFNSLIVGVLSYIYDKNYKMPYFGKEVYPKSEILKAYEGEYSSEGFPLDLKLFVEDGDLKAQATGQNAFILTAFSDSTFQFIAAGLQIEFNKDGSFYFFQNGEKRLFKKK